MARRALVTGAARGIGAAIAGRLRADGLDVVTADRDEGCDLRFDVAADPLPELGDVDVCVSNAAVTDTIAPAHGMTPEQWQRDLDVNLTGAFRIVQACLPGMREPSEAISPGRTALAVIPRRTLSAAIVFVIPSSPAFEAA